jgi:predicted RNase H-like nuclease (RuvC/YqgF family)
MNGIPKSVVDWVEKLVNETVQVFKDEIVKQQLEIEQLIDDVSDLNNQVDEARRDAYDTTSEVDYRVDNADSEIEDLQNDVRELQNKLDSLEEKNNES